MFKISKRAEGLRERTPDEITRLEAMGRAIITRRVVRPTHDGRPVEFPARRGRSAGVTGRAPYSFARSMYEPSSVCTTTLVPTVM